MKHLYFLQIFCFTAAALSGQATENFPPPAIPPVVHMVRTAGKISVDGTLNEADWQRAAVIPDNEFFRIEPKQGGHFEFKTSVRLLFDDKNLYIGVFCEDSLGKKGIRVQDFRRDFIFGENDIFFFQLDPQNRMDMGLDRFRTTGAIAKVNWMRQF